MSSQACALPASMMVKHSRQEPKNYHSLDQGRQVQCSKFRKFKIATHEPSTNYKESSYDQMLFKDVVQKFVLQHKNNVKYESAESDSHVVHSSGLLPESAASFKVSSEVHVNSCAVS